MSAPSIASVPLLQAQLVRELHYWLLAGHHGAAIRRLGWPDGHVPRIARAVAILRSDYARPIPVERLVEADVLERTVGENRIEAERFRRPVTGLGEQLAAEGDRIGDPEGLEVDTVERDFGLFALADCSVLGVRHGDRPFPAGQRNAALNS